MEHWLDHVVKPSDKATTRERYGWISEHYVWPHLGKKRLDQLTPSDVRSWVNKLAEDYAAETVKNAYRRLRTSLGVAVNDRLIRYNPCEGVTLPKGDGRKPIVLTEEQVNILLVRAVKSHLYELLIIAISTGMRRGELLGLRWPNVHLDGDNPRIVVCEQLQLVGKKATFVPPKSESSKREIPLDAVLVGLFKQHREKVSKRLGSKWDANGVVFPSLAGTPLGERNVGRSFVKLLVKAGLPHIHFHDLRHTAGSLMLAGNISLVDVSKVLGHSSPAVTARIYAHSYTENKRLAIASVTGKIKFQGS
jgi:integrase